MLLAINNFLLFMWKLNSTLDRIYNDTQLNDNYDNYQETGDWLCMALLIYMGNYIFYTLLRCKFFM